MKIRGLIHDWNDLPGNKSLFCQPPGKGIVIGNLSSQLISNIYLDQLDRFVKFELKYEHYGRYVDDFFIVVPKDELPQLLQDVVKISDYLRGLDLVLHPKKRCIQNVSHGVPFLGVVVYLNSIMPGKRFKNNFYKALMKYSNGLLDDNSIVSYLGYLKNINGKKFACKAFDKFGFDYRF